MLDPHRAADLDARIGFRIGAETFLARLADGRIEVAQDALDGVDVVVTGPASAIAAAVYGGQPLEALTAEGVLAVEGDRTLAGPLADPGRRGPDPSTLITRATATFLPSTRHDVVVVVLVAT